MIHQYIINDTGSRHSVITEPEDLTRPASGETMWLDIESEMSDQESACLQKLFGVHPLALERMLRDSRDIRMQDFETHIFIGTHPINWKHEAVKEVTVDELGTSISPYSLSLILGDRFLITAHKEHANVLDALRNRLENSVGKNNLLRADFLLYLVLDKIVDQYYELIDEIADNIDDIDSQVAEKYEPSIQKKIIVVKRRLLVVHKAISPLRDALLNIRHSENPLISEHTTLYMRDVFEHILQLLDTTETYRDVLSSTSDLILSAASNRMNEVITFLTVVSTFFLPLNFITSYYGMNLLMPEIHVWWIYPLVIALMIISIGALLIWFKRKKWL